MQLVNEIQEFDAVVRTLEQDEKVFANYIVQEKRTELEDQLRVVVTSIQKELQRSNFNESKPYVVSDERLFRIKSYPASYSLSRDSLSTIKSSLFDKHWELEFVDGLSIYDLPSKEL